jgi:hypothetical protein
MALLIGMDEAGYGPNLGPLVISATAWEVPGDGGSLAAQVCQVLLNQEKGSSWPETRLKVYPGMPRGRSLLWSETVKDLTGVTAEQMSWYVWSVGRDGRICVSGVGSYLPPEFKY